MSNDRLPINRLKPRTADFPVDKTTPTAGTRFSDEEMVEIKRVVGKRIKEAFGDATDTAIARRCRTTPTTIKAYTDGERLPVAEMLMQMHRATGVSLDWLLLGKGQKFMVEKPAVEFDDGELDKLTELARVSNLTIPEMMNVLTRAQLTAIKIIEESYPPKNDGHLP